MDRQTLKCRVDGFSIDCSTVSEVISTMGRSNKINRFLHTLKDTFITSLFCLDQCIARENRMEQFIGTAKKTSASSHWQYVPVLTNKRDDRKNAAAIFPGNATRCIQEPHVGVQRDAWLVDGLAGINGQSKKQQLHAKATYTYSLTHLLAWQHTFSCSTCSSLARLYSEMFHAYFCYMWARTHSDRMLGVFNHHPCGRGQTGAQKRLAFSEKTSRRRNIIVMTNPVN